MHKKEEPCCVSIYNFKLSMDLLLKIVMLIENLGYGYDIRVYCYTEQNILTVV